MQAITQRLTRIRARLRLRHALVPAALFGVVTAAFTYGDMAPRLVKDFSAMRASATPNPFAEARLYVDPNSGARKQAERWSDDRPREAALLERIATQPTAVWIGDWNRDVRRAVAGVMGEVTSATALPVFVAYNIPQRDCGSYSAGGSADAQAYRRWIREFARGLGGKASVVILEPDALAAMDCLSRDGREQRVSLLRDAVGVLKGAGASVYLDAGHARWIGAGEMAQRLTRAGIGAADGFSLNVSNFLPTQENLAYGASLSQRVGGKHFVIDTSRNGAGSNGEWCNPRGRALGAFPTVETGHARADAFLWIKRPGESDGTCNGGPAAGEWWPEYALELAQRQPARLASAP